jgi:hypothetical protein
MDMVLLMGELQFDVLVSFFFELCARQFYLCGQTTMRGDLCVLQLVVFCTRTITVCRSLEARVWLI